MRYTNPRRGFTLIELLIVVAIIAILAAIAVPNFLEAQVRAKVSRTKNDMRSLATAVESYYVDNNQYPHSINPLTSATFSPRVLGHKLLTTPISYISAAFPDVFNTNEAPPAGFTTADHRLIIFWSNDFLVEYRPPSGAPIDQRPRTRTIFREFGSVVNPTTQAVREPLWVMLSFSPDQDFDVLDAPGFPQAVQQYDPTNGTISDGDVVRFRE